MCGHINNISGKIHWQKALMSFFNSVAMYEAQWSLLSVKVANSHDQMNLVKSAWWNLAVISIEMTGFQEKIIWLTPVLGVTHYK